MSFCLNPARFLGIQFILPNLDLLKDLLPLKEEVWIRQDPVGQEFYALLRELEETEINP